MPSPGLIRRVQMGATLLVTIGLFGCSTPEIGPETATVIGTVTLNGKPVDDAAVSFQPATQGVGQTCQAMTDATGRFEIVTGVGGGATKPGAVPGDYVVTIIKLEMTSGEMAPPKNVLPEKYSNAQDSKLTAQVVAGNPHDFRFELTE